MKRTSNHSEQRLFREEVLSFIQEKRKLFLDRMLIGGNGMSEEKKGFFARLKEGLTKTRDNIVRGIDSVFSGFSAIDDDFYEELEEILIMGDIGVNATTAIVERLKQQVKEKHIKEPSECKQLLIELIDTIADESATHDPERITEKVASMSCKAAVKGNNRLSFKEAEELMRELMEAENPYNCPHGRPTLIKMTKYEIERKFKRIL